MKQAPCFIDGFISEADVAAARAQAAALPEASFSGGAVLRLATPPAPDTILHDIGLRVASKDVLWAIRRHSGTPDLLSGGASLCKRKPGDYPWKSIQGASRAGTFALVCHLFLDDADADVAVNFGGVERRFRAVAGRMAILPVGKEVTSRFEIRGESPLYTIDLKLWSRTSRPELTGKPGILFSDYG